MGNKKKLINKGLIELFPENISMFVDLFAGSGVVSMNIEASKYIINDITVVMTCSVYILINSFDNFFLSSLTYAICLFPYREIPIIPSIIKYCEYAEVYEYCP